MFQMDKLDASRKEDILHDFIVKTCVAQSRKYFNANMGIEFILHRLESFIEGLKYSNHVGDYKVEYGKSINPTISRGQDVIEIWYNQHLSEDVRYFYFDPTKEKVLDAFDREWSTEKLNEN